MKDKRRTHQMTAYALMAALMCIVGPLAIPIGEVPISLTTLVIYLAAYLLGAKGATVSTFVYILLGAVGLPVFTNFQGGLGKLAGPTGGYIVGYLLLAWVVGRITEKTNGNPWTTGLGMLLGTALLYALGTAWFMFVSKSTLFAALAVCVIPFLSFDFLKIVVAIVLGKSIRTALQKNNFI